MLKTHLVAASCNFHQHFASFPPRFRRPCKQTGELDGRIWTETDRQTDRQTDRETERSVDLAKYNLRCDILRCSTQGPRTSLHSLSKPKVRHLPQQYRNNKLTINYKFGQLILRKIIKTAASRCHILRLKCTKFEQFRLWLRPILCWGAHSVSQIHELDNPTLM